MRCAVAKTFNLYRAAGQGGGEGRNVASSITSANHEIRPAGVVAELRMKVTDEHERESKVPNKGRGKEIEESGVGL